MLWAKIYINDEQIDEIHVQNVGHYKGDIYKYAIRKPDLEEMIFHFRGRGWVPLLRKVLEILEDRKYAVFYSSC